MDLYLLSKMQNVSTLLNYIPLKHDYKEKITKNLKEYKRNNYKHNETFFFS